jgi:hypothetical protein
MVLKLSVASCIFILTFCKQVASFFGSGTTLLQMSIEVIQYPLTIALEGNQYPLAED